MATAASRIGYDNAATTTGEQGLSAGTNKDVVEATLRTIDKSTKSSAGVSLFHILTLASIGGSLALFFAGKKSAAIFVGLWPPTFQALKAVADTNKEDKK
ncbi:MAG: hypothetical protein JOZ96_24635 [Acidobacteria bacterium]|nr:hypothetical protein [Acidobacteriota bacterium]